MTVRRFYQLCVALPLAVPAVTWPLALFMESDSAVARGAGEVAALLAGAAFVGGVPYVLFASLLLLALRGRPESTYQQVSFVVPIVFAGFLFIFFTAIGALSPSDQGPDKAFGPGGFALWGLGFGYVYVALAHVLRVALVRLGYVRAEGAA